MNVEEIIYVIFEMSEVEIIDFSQVAETSQHTLRVSKDGSKSFIKYKDSMPSSVQSLTTRSQEYSNSQMLSILTQDEWGVEDE